MAPSPRASQTEQTGALDAPLWRRDHNGDATLSTCPSTGEQASPPAAPQTIDNEGGFVKLTKLESLVGFPVNANVAFSKVLSHARLVAAKIRPQPPGAQPDLYQVVDGRHWFGGREILGWWMRKPAGNTGAWAFV